MKSYAARSTGLTVYVRPGPTGTIARVEGEIDIYVEPRVKEFLLEVIRTHGPRLQLDLSGVSFLDCAGLRVLVVTRRRAELRKGWLRLVAASAPVRRIIGLTGLQGAFPVETPNRDAAGPREAEKCYLIDPSSPSVGIPAW